MANNRKFTAKRTKRRPRGKPFTPGDPRANVKGRPMVTPTELEVRELARQKSPDCIERLDRISRGRGSPAVKANEILLDRAWGRPKQELEHKGPDGGPVQVEVKSLNPKDLSDEQLKQLEALLQGVHTPN